MAHTAGVPGAPVDLSSIVRRALAEALATSRERRLGFVVQPGVIAWTADEPALADLLRELVKGIVATSPKSDVPILVFDELAARRPRFCALTLLAFTHHMIEPPIPERARLLAASLGVHVWNVRPSKEEFGSVCFTLETELVARAD